MTESSHSENDDNDAVGIMAHFKTRTELFPAKREDPSQV